MAEPLVIVGAGGFGRETLDVAEAMNAAATGEPVWEILGVVDDSPSELNLERLRDRGVPFLGALEDLPSNAAVAIGVGSPQTRRGIAERLAGPGSSFATLIHPTAVIGSRSTLGEGSIVCALVSLGTNVTVGHQVHLNPGCVIGHDTELADFVSINPAAAISGDCRIGARTLIGVAGVVINQVTVGADAVVGGSACVVRDVPPGSTVKGVPAR